MSSNQEEINVEALMQQIRRQILEKKAATSGDDTSTQVPVGGQRFSPEFYDHLYQAGLAYNQIHARQQLTESSVPLLGPLIDYVRQKFHELVLFYANQVADQQIVVNTHLLRALSILSEELEAEEKSSY